MLTIYTGIIIIVKNVFSAKATYVAYGIFHGILYSKTRGHALLWYDAGSHDVCPGQVE
jgi:hypothetical protein